MDRESENETGEAEAQVNQIMVAPRVNGGVAEIQRREFA